MPEQDFNTIMASLKKREFSPLYLLHGEESFFIDQVSDFIENNFLPEAERGFNQTILYGGECNPTLLRDSVMRYPMMADKQLVILKEAQGMDKMEELESIFEKPIPHTLLVLAFKGKKADGRSSWVKKINASGVVLDSKTIYQDKIPDWISKHLKEAGLGIAPEASELMAEYLGNDLSKLHNELEKLALNVPKGSKVTKDHIQEFIGINKDYNIFELQSALTKRDYPKIFRIVDFFNANQKEHPFVATLPQLNNFFSKVFIYHGVKNKSEKEILTALALKSEYFLKDYRAAANVFSAKKSRDIIYKLSHYDLRSKGLFNDGTTHEELLKELVLEICDVTR
jgi:DNA polymerase III subunit delta